MATDPPALAAELELAQRQAQAGGELRYTVHNTGAKRLTLGEQYTLERLELGTWLNVRLPFAFRAIGYALNSGGRRELTARIPRDCPAGRYRLLKQARVDRDPGPWNEWGQQRFAPLELTSEFELTAT